MTTETTRPTNPTDYIAEPAPITAEELYGFDDDEPAAPGHRITLAQAETRYCLTCDTDQQIERRGPAVFCAACGSLITAPTPDPDAPGHRITLDEAPATAPVETVDTLKRMLGDSAQALSLTLAQAETLERELAMATARAEYLAVELRCANQRADSLLEQRDAFQGLLADARSRITELAQIACDRARALDAAKSWIAGS